MQHSRYSLSQKQQRGPSYRYYSLNSGYLVCSFRQSQDTYYPAHHKFSTFVLKQLCKYFHLAIVSVCGGAYPRLYRFPAPKQSMLMQAGLLHNHMGPFREVVPRGYGCQCL